MSQNCTLKMVKTATFMLCTFHPNKKAYFWLGNCLHSETIHFSLLSKVLFDKLLVFQSNKFKTHLSARFAAHILKFWNDREDYMALRKDDDANS